MSRSDIMDNLRNAFLTWPLFVEILTHWCSEEPLTLTGVEKGARSFLTMMLFAAGDKQGVLITETIEEAQQLAEELICLDPDAVSLFPAWEVLPSDDLLPSDDILAERFSLIQQQILVPQKKRLVVMPLQALMMKVVSLDYFKEHIMTVTSQHQADREALIRHLVAHGYVRVSLVQYRGEFAVRGGIVDIYNMVDHCPVRLEWDGDVCESIRSFDSGTQRTVQHRDAVHVFPRSDVSLIRNAPPKHLCSVVSYFQNSCLFIMEPDRINHVYSKQEKQLTNDAPWMVSHEAFQDHCQKTQQCEMSLLDWPGNRSSGQTFSLPMTSFELLKSDRKEFLSKINADHHQGYQLVICCHNDGEETRLRELWQEQGFTMVDARCVFLQGAFKEGFCIEDIRLIVVTDDEIFGRYKQRPAKPRFHRGAPIAQMMDLKKGDYVVHVGHGIGIYQGVKKLELDGVRRDYCVILYDQETKLMLPIEQINLIQRYIGVEKIKPKLNRIGGQAWSQTKLKVAKQIKDVAADLLRVQAMRAAQKGFACQADNHWQREFEDAFIYEETVDQTMAIEDTKHDMQEVKPMDRLICGDVGYGKTEVAMRAAFKAVMNDKQVAVLVPTTILAEQHLHTFQERMAEYPIRIACFTRFNTVQETKDIVAGLKEGHIDIVIGTHKLVMARVIFQDLGLVIIDEEQRFGVMHKERLKQLRCMVDVLTLSATPIPRTLYLSLTGAKDMSVMTTPPQERLSVQTMVVPFRETIIRDAVLRETHRGGQVYFVHNRVYNIEVYAKKLQDFLPGVRIAVGHGQMGGRGLEQVMQKFIAKEVDVLVCTTIIQSGLDIPNANTIFIHHAEKYGLADLYQLRGRVGRFKHRGYCYLITSEDRVMSEDAAKRLHIIEEFTDLGSGMKVAMRDLEIRGAGNILGIQQSGTIAQVGFELYCQLLDQTIRRMKGEECEMVDVVIDLGLDIGIPSDYISDGQQRMDVFRRLANLSQGEDLDQIKTELRDRFGHLPKACDVLFLMTELRIQAKRKKISYLGIDKNVVVVERAGLRKKVPAALVYEDDISKVQAVMGIVDQLPM